MSATFILDGSNLAWLGPGDGPALAPVDAIADALRTEWPGCKVITVCDASLRHRLDAADKAEHKRRTTAGDLVEAPADEDADAYILDAARRLSGCVVTRDLYRDRREARAGLPMLRPALIGGAVILGDPKVFADADSDRAEPLPADALGERIAPAPLPGGEPIAAAVEEDPAEPTADAAEQPDDGPDAPAPDASEPADELPAEPEVPEPPVRKRPARSQASAPKRPAARKKKAPPKTSPTPRDETLPAAGPGRGGLALLVLGIVVIGGIAAWSSVDEAETDAEPDVLFVRNCKGWAFDGLAERIVFHARPGQCAVSIAALEPSRYALTVAEGDGPSTEGAVRLVTADARGEVDATQVTAGRRGDGTVTPEEATARIVGVHPATSTVVLRVSPGAERPDIWLVRDLSGRVLRHAEHLAGVALSPSRAAALRHHCAGGCGTVHVAEDLTAALDAAEVAEAPAGRGRRWAGPAAFSPDGRTLAVAEDFDGAEGGVVLLDASGERRIPFTARERGEVTGLAWTAGGLYFATSGALYRLGDDGATWAPVSRKPESLAPAWPPGAQTGAAVLRSEAPTPDARSTAQPRSP